MKHAKTSRIFSLLALVLAVAMLLTLVGCGGSDKKPEKKPAPKVNYKKVGAAVGIAGAVGAAILILAKATKKKK